MWRNVDDDDKARKETTMACQPIDECSLNKLNVLTLLNSPVYLQARRGYLAEY